MRDEKQKLIESVKSVGEDFLRELAAEKQVSASLQAKLDAIRARMAWKYPGKGELPKDDRDVCVYRHSTGKQQVAWYEPIGQVWFCSESEYAFLDGAAWHELKDNPTPPQKEDE